MRRLAILNIALHVIGLAVAFFGMRPGSPLLPLDDRMSYLAARPIGWSAGWVVWMSCALALVAFVAALRPYAGMSELSLVALVLAGAGAGIDLFCDVGQIVVLPDVAAWRPAQPALFVSWERLLGAGGAVVANGLYSAAVFLVALSLRRRVPAYAFAIGLASCGAGIVMVVAGFTGNARLLEASVGPTIGSFILWCAATAWVLRPREA